MCGIAGFFGHPAVDMEAIIHNMVKTLHHRGPDDSGVWFDDYNGLALGHARLSIMDISPAGHQPMISRSGRYIIVYNGEVYNFSNIRRLLENNGSIFKGNSDTEVILESIEAWGLEKAVQQFSGMFAFALWDKKERVLHLVRDRLGEKPLYYGFMGNTFLFSSELKALKVHPEFRTEINRDALALFLRHNYIPTPYSIYQNIYKLPPGTILSIDITNNSIPYPIYYWSAKEVAQEGTTNLYTGTDNEAIIQLDKLMRNAVSQQMVADVPLGAFLSGGIDSSLVVALMQVQSKKPVKTFTIGFHETSYNEAAEAREVANYLGTEHTELYVTPQEALDVIPKLPILYDEPFSDSSQIPTFLVAKLARKHVTVSLSGDGGDELFGGYNRYFWGRNFWSKIGWLPSSWRKIGANVLTVPSPQTWNYIFNGLTRLLSSKLNMKLPGDKLYKLAEILPVKNPQAMYRQFVSHWKNPSSVVLNSNEPLTILTDEKSWPNLKDFTQWMMYLDTVTYLPDDILVKVDRAAMGVSLESRVPFLDHRVVEFAWRLPLAMKIRNGQGKWLLRQVLYQYVPPNLIERPKMGFSVPIDEWLRGPLRDWAEELLNEKRLREDGFFDPVQIREKWNEHLSGKRNWHYYLWDVMMFQAWMDQ